MKLSINHLVTLTRMSLYNAPDDANITPVTIPKQLQIIELITGGEVSFKVDGKYKTFGKGAIFWHLAGEKTIWRTTTKSPYRCAVFHFKVNKQIRPLPRVSFWQSTADIDKFVAECLNLFHSKELDIEILTLYIYSSLLRHAMINPKRTAVQDYPKILNRILAYIHNHHDHKLSVKTIANKNEISQPHLFRLFNQHLQTTPHRYILGEQITRAKTMLAASDLPIKAIAIKTGFESIEVFYRQFKRESGMPPGEYRKKYQPYRFGSNS